MRFVPGGALVAGTPPGSLPRVADEEVPGEQVILKGFYIDEFPFPNEEGAIPLTNVTQAEAADLCSRAGKRLCSELEWERACKGPHNRRYEYGDRYVPARCQTGAPASLRPNGIRVGCRSDFGVRDLHGGVWEWTDSPWGRGTDGALGTLRGGNAPAGEVVGRCANGRSQPIRRRSPTVGLRCCAGPRNEAEVVLKIERGAKLESRRSVPKPIASQLLEQLPAAVGDKLQGQEDFRIQRSWIWHPIGNEELLVVGGCAGLGRKPICGVIVARVVLDRAAILTWASSGHRLPSVQADVDARDAWLFGGDGRGSFRRLVEYAWGGVNVGPKERRVPKRD